METIQDILNRLSPIISAAHRVACALDIGDERTEAFELYEALRRLQRHGAAGEMLAATNPLIRPGMMDYDSDCYEDWGEDDD